MLDPRLVRLAKTWLPPALLARLDPFEHHMAGMAVALGAEASPQARVLDAGAGEGRFRPCFKQSFYVGLDRGIGDREWDYSGLDIIGDLSELPLKTASFDYIICMVVLEHTPEPAAVLREFWRILRAGGGLRMVAPLMWEEHQKPQDFFRFTSHGLDYLLRQANLPGARIEPIGGFFWVLGRRCVNLLTFFQRGWRWIVFFALAPFFGFILPLLCYYLDRLDREKHFTLGYAVTARKSDG